MRFTTSCWSTAHDFWKKFDATCRFLEEIRRKKKYQKNNAHAAEARATQPICGNASPTTTRQVTTASSWATLQIGGSASPTTAAATRQLTTTASSSTGDGRSYSYERGWQFIEGGIDGRWQYIEGMTSTATRATSSSSPSESTRQCGNLEDWELIEEHHQIDEDNWFQAKP